MDRDERSAVSPSLVEERSTKASCDPPESQPGYLPPRRDLQHAGEIRRYSFKDEFRVALDHYLRMHEAMSRDLRHPCSQIVLEDAHIVHSRLESLRLDLASSKPRPLSAPHYNAGVSAVHEFVERFLRHEPNGLTLSGLRSYLCKENSIECFSTIDLWSIPDCLSIRAIESICTSARSTGTADSGVERIGALHSLLAELQNTQWLKVMPDISRLDPILNNDPSADFHRMDAETKDAYRRAVAQIARSFRLPEETIAFFALDLARQSARDERVERTHVGYYLVGQGVNLLRSRLGPKRAFWHYFSRSIRNRTLLLLMMAVVAVILGMCVSRAIAVNLNDSVPTVIRMLLGSASTVLCSVWLIWCFKTIVTIFISPSKIPCLNYSEGVPLSAKTLVVIPCLLSEASDPIRMKERLLMQFLRNRTTNVSYALLTDWADSGTAVHAEDEGLLASASIMIGELNTAYGSKDAGFLLLHRPRIWSDREGVWMGKARKYGKLLDLNRLLATGNEDGFSTICGDKGHLREVKYVITIDNDADLPYGVVARMIATIDHPLNRPRLSASRDRVAWGFGLLQPLVSALALKDDATRYEAAIAQGGGLKVYQSPCPGFYNDFLDAGSYVGKGIYDVRCANAVLPQVIDCEKILSHDLLEGGALNATTISNVDIFESAPKSYGSEMARQSRWIRGDTQNLLWVLSNPSKMQKLGPLTVWKVIECFAGHLVDPCLLLIAILSCTYADTAWLALLVAAALFLSPAMKAARKAIRRLLSVVPIDGSGIWKAVLNDFQIALLHSFTLPHRAAISLKSIFISSYRFIFSKKKLLEWSTFDQMERSELSGRSRDYFVVNFSFAVIAFLLGLRAAPINMSIGICFAASWLLALPMVRYLNSRYRSPNTLGQDDLVIVAWRTWSFFRRVFLDSQSKLVPDSIENNWSDRRTSPTNIGLSLVALVSAQKLSLISRSSAVSMAFDIIESINKLKKNRGHLYNWYNIDSLEAIGSRTISSADSANFAACLIVLKEWLLEPAPARELRFLAERYIHLSSCIPRDVPYTGSDDPLGRLLGIISRIARCEYVAKEELSAAIEVADELDADSEWAKALLMGASECESAIASEKCLGAMEKAIEQGIARAKADFSCFLDVESDLLRIELPEEGSHEKCAVYDLLASESRLATFIGVALSNLPSRTWGRLGRSKISSSGGACLLSWGGSLFENLFADLFMPAPKGSLLYSSSKNFVRASIKAAHGGIWGKSECAYQDPAYGIVYGPVGIQELALCPSVIKHEIVAPYATLLAIRYEGEQVIENLRALTARGALGPLGLFESLMFDALGKRPEPLWRNYSHHQGIVLASIANHFGGAISELFLRDAEMRAASILLREPWPENAVIAQLHGST